MAQGETRSIDLDLISTGQAPELSSDHRAVDVGNRIPAIAVAQVAELILVSTEA